MNSSMDWRVERCLQLFGDLKQTAAKFAKREETLAKELSSRRNAVNRVAQEATAAKDTNYSTQLNNIEASFGAEMTRVKTVYETRQNRVNRYSSTRVRELPRLAQEKKGKWKGELQMLNRRAERKMAEAIAEADADYPGFSTKLEAHWKSLIALEKEAKTSFRGYLSLLFALGRKKPMPYTADSSLAEIQKGVNDRLVDAERQLFEFQQFAVPKFFKNAPLWVFFLLTAGAVGGILWQMGMNMNGYGAAAIAVGVFVVIWIIHLAGVIKAKPIAKSIAHSLVESRQMIQGAIAAGPAMAAKREGIRKEIEVQYEAARAEIDAKWAQADHIEQDFEQKERQKVETLLPRINQKIDSILQRKLQAFETNRLAWHEHLKNEAATAAYHIGEQQQTGLAGLIANEQAGWGAIVADWQNETTPIYKEIAEIQTSATEKFPAWDPVLVEAWKAPIAFTPATKFGQLSLDLANPPTPLPKDPRLALPGPKQLTLPLALTFPAEGSLLFETKDSGVASVIGTMNNVILRLLTTTPPGKISFTFIDPVGLGQSFSGLMHLADYEETLVNRRIWTQRDQIEERLAELAEHVEKVLQMYLRNEYATITEYNEKAGSVAEKYYFLVVADFPANFSDVAVKRLQSIAQSGPRCGIFTLIHWDQRSRNRTVFARPMNCGKTASVFKPGRKRIRASANSRPSWGSSLALDPPASSRASRGGTDPQDRPEPALTRTACRCRSSQVAPPPGEEWTGRHDQRIARRRWAHRGDQAAVSRHRQGHAPARALRRKNRLGQIDALPRHHHQPRAYLQP